MKKMFLAGPFKAIVDKTSGTMSQDDVDLFSSIIDYFEGQGWSVHCAHKREKWGREFMEPAVCTVIDYEEISKADVLVAFPGSPASPGTHIELGWASAMKKPIVMLLEEGKEYAFLVRGLPEITNIEHVTFSGKALDPKVIEDAIDRFEVAA